MKKNIYSLTVLISIAILTINIFTKSKQLTSIIIFSINLFIKNIFPTLFPMFIISHLLVEIGIPEFLGSKFNKLFIHLFKTTPYSSFVFFMSLITGFPSSAKYVNDLIEKNKINNNEAEKILKFTFFSNPLFIINTIGISFLHNKKIGLYILISHILGNIITGIILNKKDKIYKEIKLFTYRDLIEKTNDSSIIKTLLTAIKNSLDILINIFGLITFSLIVSNITINNPNNYIKVLITGLIEMTTGLKYLSTLSIPFKLKVLTSTLFISFGGLSIHAQIINILKEKKVKYLPFLISRIIHSIISSIIIYILIS